jgi:hypothetical protein
VNLQQDFQTFLKLFGAEKVKSYPNKVECRGISDMEAATAEANRIINANKLKLAVVTSGALASYKAFEVVSIADREAAAV